VAHKPVILLNSLQRWEKKGKNSQKNGKPEELKGGLFGTLNLLFRSLHTATNLYCE
jgi:hypothetical protein